MKKIANPNLHMWHPSFARFLTDFTNAKSLESTRLRAGAMRRDGSPLPILSDVGVGENYLRHERLPFEGPGLHSCTCDDCGVTVKLHELHFSFAYSALACFRMGTSGSASFHSVRKS